MRFRAMGTEVTVHAPSGDEATIAERVARCFAEREGRFSRFRPDSELSMLNRAEPMAPVKVSEPMFAALLSARRWHAATDGLFDPGVGASMRALGYDRSFARDGAGSALDDAQPAGSAPRGSIRELLLDERERTARRPAHLQVDLGGLVKGRTVDEAVAAVAPTSQGALAVDAGGDAALIAEPDSEGWLVDLEDPRDARRVLLTLRLRDHCVATSATNRRVWRRGEERMHHLIDPRTGRPSRTDLAQVTVVASTTEAADVLAKVLFLLGERGARRVVAGAADLAAVLVRDDGKVVVLGEVEVDDDRAA